MCFDIRYDHKIVGTATVTQNGLYYTICCRCTLPNQGLHRILIQSGDKQTDIGICVPIDGMYGMNTSVAARNVDINAIDFILVPQGHIHSAESVSLDPEKPFAYLHALESMRLSADGRSLEMIEVQSAL